MINLGNDWDNILKDEFEKDYYKNIRSFLKTAYSTKVVYPDMYSIFNALKLTSYDDVKAVIIGQDPYHGEGQAHGLAFSVQDGVALPPSLRNIFKELNTDLGLPLYTNGNLTKWAKNGVLLLNATLTVEGGKANSHKNIGWQTFTDNIIKSLNEREKPIVFILWGNNARMKKALITNPNHLVLESAHPSPLSAYNGFFGCKHFSKANNFLKQYNMEIDWSL